MTQSTTSWTHAANGSAWTKLKDVFDAVGLALTEARTVSQWSMDALGTGRVGNDHQGDAPQPARSKPHPALPSAGDAMPDRPHHGGASSGTDPGTQLSILAALTLIPGILVLVAGLFVAWGIWFGTAAGTAVLGPFGWFIPGMLESIIGVIVAVALVLSLPAILGGIGLIQRAEWGRVLTFLTAAGVGLFALVSFTFVPLAYSAYAFWVLSRDDVVRLFERGQRPPGTETGSSGEDPATGRGPGAP